MSGLSVMIKPLDSSRQTHRAMVNRTAETSAVSHTVIGFTMDTSGESNVSYVQIINTAKLWTGHVREMEQGY